VTEGTACAARDAQSQSVPREYRFYVYILQSSSRRALYIGMTNNLHRRVFEHKMHLLEGFTDDYNAVRLVYWERFEDVHRAIAREKQLKGWRREKKFRLIEQFNPKWRDLAADWYEDLATQITPAETRGPSTCPRMRSGVRSG
jgi:putative endonuclease